MSTASTSSLELYDVEEEESFTLSIENGELYLNKHDADYNVLGAVRQLKHTSYGCRYDLLFTFTNCAASLPFVVHVDKFCELTKWLGSGKSELIFNMNLIKGEPLIAARAAMKTAS
jgi:hypothetical protein